LKPLVTTEISQLKTQYPEAHCALKYETPYQLLVATILSAQCTDERVNKVTENLFRKYPEARDLAVVPLKEVEELIKSTGFYRNKAKNIKETSEILVKNYKGQVPSTMDELIQLKGVGRKTANVVLGNAFHIPSGVVVDTHVLRLSNRLGWVKSQNPVTVENELIQLVDKNDWILISHLLIEHGRRVCKARSPKCKTCFLAKDCPKRGVTLD
jgi:endonuclease-3